MKRICALLLAVCTVISGCGTETADYGQSLGQTAEQMMETGTETEAEMAPVEEKETLVFSFLEDGTVSFDKVALKSLEKEKKWKKLYENKTLGSEISGSIQSYIERKQDEIEDWPILQGGLSCLIRERGLIFP